jgi:uncharacterized ferritin-like protein (DUF455 family)
VSVPAPVPFGIAIRRLSALAGVMHHSIRIACRLLLDTPSIDLKVAAGHRIGRDARVLAALHRRLDELTTASSHTRLPQWTDATAGSSDPLTRLAALEHDAKCMALAMASTIDVTCDAPTAEVLAAAVASLADDVIGRTSLGGTGDSARAERSTRRFAGDLLDCASLVEPPEVSSPSDSFPARPNELRYDRVSIAATLTRPLHECLDDPHALRLFFHFVCIDIEIPAMEVCAASLLRHPAMPIEFVFDLARQIHDEARHAVAMHELLRAYGGRVGDHTYCGHVWQRFHEGNDLAEQLMIQQVIQEGNSLDGNAVLVRAFREFGLEREATILEYINADEAMHARLGNRWTRWLLGGDEARHEALVTMVSHRIGRPVPGAFPIDADMRRLAGFSPRFVARHACALAEPPPAIP